MSLVNALQAGKVMALPTNANVNINLGNGHSNIAVTAKNANIDTGCGNQNIVAVVSENLTIDTGFCGEDKILANVGGNATITTREDNDYINLKVGGNFQIDSGMVHPQCGAEEDDDVVLVRGNLDKTDGYNYVATGEGNDNVRIIANNVDVEKNEGNLVLGFFGDNYTVNSEASNNTIGFWGDNVDINISGEGKQDIKTLDFSFEEGRFLDFGFEDLLAQDTYMGSSYDTVVEERLTGKNNLDEVAQKYGLSAAQTEQLKSLDLTKTTSKGQPYYLLYKSGNTYNIGYRDDKNNVYDMNGKKLNYSTSSSRTEADGNKRRTTTTTTTSSYTGNVNIDVEREKEVTTTTTRTDYYNIDGVKNVNINITQNGNYNIGLTADDGYVNINGMDALNNTDYQNIIVRSGYIVQDQTVCKDVQYIMEKLALSAGNMTKSTSTSSTGWYTYKDPLVLDTNKDGVVSTIKNNAGIDIDNDGKVDGSAAGGDKMLAMSDLNGNGKIDGNEVFGDETISPFTKKKLNAANGFEALKQIAIEAKAYTGIDCMNGNNVDVQKLAQALLKVNVNLGLVGEGNATKIDSLGDIKAINTDYKEIDGNEGVIQHNQKSTYTDINGFQFQIDDVWFRG